MINCGNSGWVAPTIIGSGGTALLASSLYDPTCDLLCLHYDCAADLDDIHALASGYTISQHFGITPEVVVGTFGWDNNRQQTYTQGYNGMTRQQAINQVATLSYGAGNYYDTDGTFAGMDEVALIQAEKYKRVLDAGCDVWIAEGGPSDFTSRVLSALVSMGVSTSVMKNNIHVVQHHHVNESNTDDGNLSFVQSNTDYIKIDDGNNPNNTADLRDPNGVDPAFFAWATSTTGSAAWNFALTHYDPAVDFSDTVEYLHILGIGQNLINDITDFCNYF